jgi:hypothetical protein
MVPMTATAVQSAAAEEVREAPKAPRALRWSGAGLIGASWVSAAVFGLYIVFLYPAALRAGQLAQWNENLPGLYAPHHAAALLAMAAHLAAGAVILVLGPVQLLGAVRRRWPALHRRVGRLYVLTPAVAGAGGLTFLVRQGTIGGGPMDAGFGLYGALALTTAVQTYRHARARRFDQHRAWAIRPFALAMGSWLYRMDYGFWLLAMHRLGHTEDFRGPFDIVMSFFFYLPNLAVAEVYLRGRAWMARPAVKVAGVVALNLATAVVLVGSYYFFRFYWGPAIVNGMLGRGQKDRAQGSENVIVANSACPRRARCYWVAAALEACVGSVPVEVFLKLTRAPAVPMVYVSRSALPP